MSRPEGARRGLGSRIFRLAAAAFPSAFSRRHVAEMTAAFEQERDRIRLESGPFAAAWYSVRAGWDVLRQGVRERVRRGPPPGHGSRKPSGGGGIGSGLGADVRVALRALRRSPGFTVAALAVLALGIGANATVFSALRVVILTPPPYPEPDRLVFVPMTQEHVGRGERRLVTWSYATLQALLKTRNRLIEPLAGYANRSAPVTGRGPATVLTYELVSSTYFDVLGLTPAAGRTFTPDDDDAGADPLQVAIISHEMWLTRFSGDDGTLGQDIVVEGTPFRIVGVAPRGFRGLSGDAQFWVPLAAANEVLGYRALDQAGAHWFHVVGRLRDDASLESATAQMHAIGDRIAETYPSGDPQSIWSATAQPFGEVFVNEPARAAVVLLTAAGLVVLLVACANLSGLLLARAKRRERDGAVRIAVGASRWRIVRGSLVESVLVSSLGGVVGSGLALWGTGALASAWPGAFLRSAEGDMRVADLSHLGLEPPVLLFAVAATMATALLFGAAPAIRRSRTDVSTTLKDASAVTRRERGFDGRAVLVGAQVAMALMLLVGAGLVGSSTVRLLDVDEGVRTENLLALRYATPATSTWADRQREFQQELLTHIEALPVVVSATTGTIPLQGHWAMTRVDHLEGGPEIPQGEGVMIGVHMVEDGYFETLGVPRVSGRTFDSTDGTDRFPTLVISQSTAAELFPGEDAVGKRIQIGISDDSKDSMFEIVGVVGDVLYSPPDQPRMAETYISDREFGTTTATVLVRTTIEPTRVVPAIRETAARIDPTLAIYGVRTMDEIVTASVGDRRIILVLLTLFAVVAVLLAATGTWGIVAVSVADRRRELGLRLALGAGDARVLRMVLRQSAVTAALGVALGLAGAAAGSRLLEAFLWETPRLSLSVYVGGALLLLSVVLLASWLPARAVLRLDPAETLRSD